MNLDHNYGGGDKLRLVTDDPASFRVLVYNSTDWLLRRRSEAYALASAAVDGDGRWLKPIILGKGAYHVIAKAYQKHFTLAQQLVIPGVWDGSLVYALGALVDYAGHCWRSSQNLNKGYQPDTATSWWTRSDL
jgi:hypothetical protein